MRLEDYQYHLPEEKIARYPLKDRSNSKLLCYKECNIFHHHFYDLPEQLPEKSLLIFNDTRVIPARLFFTKSTGALIEIFLLEPVSPYNQREMAMKASAPVQWQCMIRNLKKWKGEDLKLKYDQEYVLSATLTDRQNQIVEFTWTPANRPFAEVLEKCGKIPLPPYMQREPTEDDTINYQTVYARQKGAVAAPTAGLHFTPEIILALKSKGIQTDYLTLHVSAGTFQPIKAEDVKEHQMHEEEVIITRDNLIKILQHDGMIIPVGTTSMRTLESLYWYGVKLLTSSDTTFFIEKLAPYQDYDSIPSKKESITAVLNHFDENNLTSIAGKTEIFIFPGYNFRLCQGLITNFHLPGSTLILLVAALLGDDWRKVYQEALNKDYRFLSYGDSSLLLP